MFHGGTNFGLWNGANSPSQVIITSYDYDAPISEAGDITTKYLVLQDLFYKVGASPQASPPHSWIRFLHFLILLKLKQQVPPPPPVNVSKADYGKIGLKFVGDFSSFYL